MKFQPRKPPSAAEHRLAEAQKAKAEAESRDGGRSSRPWPARKRRTRSRSAHGRVEPYRQDELAEMSQWATDPNGRAAPTPDVERRAGLMKRIEAAEAQARSAAGAMAGPRAAIAAAGARASAAQTGGMDRRQARCYRRSRGDS